MSPAYRDVCLNACLKSAGASLVLILVLIAAFLFYETWPLFINTSPVNIISDDSWAPLNNEFGMWPMLAGSILVVTGALFLSLPLGIATAIFIVFFAPRFLAKSCHRIVELLAGLPSVVYGFWGIVVLVPAIATIGGAGTSLLAGIIVLAIMILPLVSLVAIATFERLDNQQLQSAWLLGMKKSAIVWYIVLPLSRQSLISGSLLQTARALGETMAVLMVCGNVVAIPNSFLAPVRTLTANIALETAYAMDAHRSALFAGGLLLALFVFILLMLIYRMHGSVSHAHE